MISAWRAERLDPMREGGRGEPRDQLTPESEPPIEGGIPLWRYVLAKAEHEREANIPAGSEDGSSARSFTRFLNTIPNL